MSHNTVVAFPTKVEPNVNPSMIDPPALLADSPSARQIIIELEHEIADLNAHIVFQSRELRKLDVFRVKRRLVVGVAIAFLVGWVLGHPRLVRDLEGYMLGDQAHPHEGGSSPSYYMRVPL